jgi:fucokinase
MARCTAAVRTALRLMGSHIPGGIEIKTDVDVPMGSGLGTSSILAATVLRALAEMSGESLDTQALSNRSMRLEQMMTTGGSWQDQAGGIFPGAKLVSSGPGLRQRLRVQPVGCSGEKEREFEERLILYFTGIRRIAKGLLQQVVGRYLARETATVQVLHSIKTLAMEMAYAMQEGDWDYRGNCSTATGSSTRSSTRTRPTRRSTRYSDASAPISRAPNSPVREVADL